MSDFSQPEYASYVALCRELRLPRELQSWDWVDLPDDLGPASIGSLNVSYFDAPAEAIWLPSLSDWLEMLWDVDEGDIGLWQDSEGGWHCDPLDPDDGCPHSPHPESSPTREEAAARLWMAVTKPAVPE